MNDILILLSTVIGIVASSNPKYDIKDVSWEDDIIFKTADRALRKVSLLPQLKRRTNSSRKQSKSEGKPQPLGVRVSRSPAKAQNQHAMRTRSKALGEAIIEGQQGTKSPSRTSNELTKQSPAPEKKNKVKYTNGTAVQAAGPAVVSMTDWQGRDHYLVVPRFKTGEAASYGNPAHVVATVYGKDSNPPLYGPFGDPTASVKARGQRVSVVVAPPKGGFGNIKIDTPERSRSMTVPGGIRRQFSGEAEAPFGVSATASITRSPDIDGNGGFLTASSVHFPITGYPVTKDPRDNNQKQR